MVYRELNFWLFNGLNLIQISFVGNSELVCGRFFIIKGCCKQFNGITSKL